MTTKKFIKKLHLWIGLPGAVIFFFICITGSLFVFADEITELANKPYSEINNTGKDWIPVNQMLEIIEKKFPNQRITYITANKKENSSLKFLLMGKDGLTDVFINPYNGKITGKSRAIQFFYVLGHLHSMLLWHGPGGWIIKIATILFFITLLSGLIIWWPKTNSKKSVKNAFSYKRKMPYKRHIFDLHRVWGFYGFSILLLLTFTGLILAFKPLSNIISKSAGGNPDLNFITEYPVDTTRSMVDLGPVIKRFLQKPEVDELQISLFFINQASVFRLQTGTRVGIITNNGSIHFINQYTGKEVINDGIIKDMEVNNMLVRLHTGKYLGWLGLIITFFGGLLGAFLSVSGVLLWLRKIKN